MVVVALNFISNIFNLVTFCMKNKIICGIILFLTLVFYFFYMPTYLKKISFKKDIGFDRVCVDIYSKYSNGVDNLWIIETDDFFADEIIKNHKLKPDILDKERYINMVNKLSNGNISMNSSISTVYSNITDCGYIIYIHSSHYSAVIIIHA